MKSRLVDQSHLDEHLSEWKKLPLDKLCSRIVGAGWITEWQCDKLKSGKHRGFFLGNYKLVDQISRDGISTTYAATESRSKLNVQLRVTPPHDGDPMSVELV